jgi:hypothetical protein
VEKQQHVAAGGSCARVELRSAATWRGDHPRSQFTRDLGSAIVASTVGNDPFPRWCLLSKLRAAQRQHAGFIQCGRYDRDVHEGRLR